jgi:hypothetical protein
MEKYEVDETGNMTRFKSENNIEKFLQDKGNPEDDDDLRDDNGKVDANINKT